MTTLAADHARLMDRTYRYTRHVYDLSRRYYLLGRDRLLRGMPIQPGDAVIEIGCGTARNLIKLARLHPQARLFGLDASQKMLDTAAANLRRAGFAERVTLRHGLAEDLDFRAFGLDRPFDAAIFSYCLSMVPPWREAIDAALGQLGPGGTLGIVDFYDQRDLPAWFNRMLICWLTLFHVRYRPELPVYLESAALRECAAMQLSPLARRYALIATVTKP